MRAPDSTALIRRRNLLPVAIAAGLAGTVQAAAASSVSDTSDWSILTEFGQLPGTVALKIWAPATSTKPELLIARNGAQKLFVGSAVKAFVLCERMRQLDGPDILGRLTATDAKGEMVPDQLLALDESVWTVDSASFNPPYLTGRVTERTAMEAMILHSDNTATDMELKATGPDRVRRFLAEAGLRSSAVPDSTRSFFGYLLGAKDSRAFTWADLVAAGKTDAPIVNLPLNDVQTLASSADDLVSFYARSVQGEFFEHEQTRQQYRDVLSLGDVINLVPFPAGASAFAKGGSIDVPGFHALCIPGAMFFGDRWVYLAAILNWEAAGQTDASMTARFVAVVRDLLDQVYAALQ